MKRMTRLTALLLALVMVCSAVPFAASAAETAEEAGIIADTGHSLNLEGAVHINQYAKITGFDGVDVAENGGLLVFKSPVSENEATIENADEVHTGLVKNGSEYMQRTDGIPAKEYANELYLRVYVKDAEGNYVYGPVTPYSVQEYCEGRLEHSDSENMKNLAAAMLHYGTAAQMYFKYNTKDLANANIVENWPAAEWDSGLLTPLKGFTTDVESTGDVQDTGKSLTLVGAIKVNFYFQPVGWTAAGAELLVWDGVNEELTADNASYTVKMVKDGNDWMGTTEEIVAKEMGKTIFAAARFVDTDGGVHYSDVMAYSPEAYAEGRINKSTNANMVELAKRMVIYGEYAAIYFGVSENEPEEKPETDKVEVSADVSVENGAVKDAVSMETETVKATVPSGVAVEDGASQLTLSVQSLAETTGDITVGETEERTSLDVHVEGVAADNTTAIVVELGAILAPGLNKGNVVLYHVENGVTNAMTQVDNETELDTHNEFHYDPVTGDVSVAMASFSEVAAVVDTTKAWKGEFDYSWYNDAAAPVAEGEPDYVIANADQLAAFGAIVGGMDGQTQNSFAGKTVKLIADVNLNDAEAENTNKIFHPIGYYYINGDSGVYSFEGTFDGNGHTIANFYQNTWEIKGDYSGTYYKDAMGLFGYVVNGTVKNLTVDNFSSDGEYTPTGVIAAYAVNSTFENIAITDCNPRVYNTGNGGIVGIGGNNDDPDTYKLTFTNITIDNTNKITALWGSWDVACGGLVGMFRGAGHVYMTNCHVAAQIDVYNDVCGNYQYYWYRYAGMMIGTNKNMVTDEAGYTVPETSKYHAASCTVHFGDWNDYYYCELVANSLASYTHDHQFSRLEQISSLDEIKSGDTWLKTGNFILMNGKTPTETCYHIVKDANGVLVQHNHEDAGEETVNGEIVLKENNQRIYLPFNQLFTGYGWGVKHIPVYNGEDYAFEGITILDREVANSVEKFESIAENSYTTGTTVTIGELFKAKEQTEVEIDADNVQVTVSPVDDSTADGTYVANTDDWTLGTLTFSGIGKATITITDYYFCTPTTISVTIEDRQPVEKFETLFTGDFLYRVGNQNAVKLSSLFNAENVTGTVAVTVETVEGNASGIYTSNATWGNGTIKFDGTGVVKVIITDNDYCTPTELLLEVVDAVNATAATSATSNNVVLLNDCGFSSLEVSGGYTLFGNGFTMTCGSDSVAADLGYSFVTLNNGTLDNVQIVCPNFDYAALYKSNLSESDNRSNTDSSGKTRYYNARSGVMVSGNSQILNSRISGARAAVNVSGGNCVIDNSRIELGAVASVLVGAANSLTLRDVTLVQKPTESTCDSSKKLMGFSVLLVCDADGNAAPVTIEGTLIQNAWVDESDKQYVPSAGQSIISTVLAKTEYLHDLDGDGTNESLNLGFAYMPESLTSPVNAATITDSRSNKEAVPYDYAEVSIMSGKTYVYSYKNTNGTANDFKTESEYKPNKYGDIITVAYSDTADGLTAGKSFSTDGWVYELNVDLDKLPDYALDFSKLFMTVNGVAVTDFKVNGGAKPESVAVTAGGTTYTLTATINGTEYTAAYKVTGTETSKDSPQWSSDANGTALSATMNATWEDGLCVASSYGGTWHGAAPALQNVYVRYWSVADGAYKVIHLAEAVTFDTGKLNGANNTWTFTPENGDFTLTLTGGQVHSGNSVNAMPVGVKTDSWSKLYFVAASSNGLVNTGNSARTIPVTYSFEDNNGGTVLTGSHTWSVAENKDDQYKYSDFCNGTLTKLEASSGGGDCVTGDSLITLADGTQKRIDQLTYQDELLVWDFWHGCYTTTTASVIFNHGDGVHKVTNLRFSDGTSVGVIGEHEFFDVDANSFVCITEENVAKYIGHSFVKANGADYSYVVLESYDYTEEEIGNYTVLTAKYNNAIIEGMFSLTPDPTNKCEDFFRLYKVGEDMKFDEAKMQADIEKYGLFAYEDLADYVTYEEFVAFNGEFYKILVGKGLITVEDIVVALATYAPNH